MYARYIPPSAGQTPSKREEVAPAHASPASTTPAMSTVAQVVGDGFSYTRYIPGAKPSGPTPQTKSEATPQKPEAPIIQYFDDEPSPPKPKRKRDEEELKESQSKKSRKAGKKDVDESENAQLSGSEVEKSSKKKKGKKDKKIEAAEDEVDETGGSKSKKSKKKDKKEKTESESLEEMEDERERSETVQEDVPEVNNTKPKDEVEEVRPKKEKRKSKKTEKNKEPSLETEDEKTDTVPQDEDVEMADAAEPEVDADTEAPEPEKPKERKAKKEKKKKIQEDALEEASEEEDQRHKAVLERKAKSLKFAEIIKERGIDETPEEPVELHGLEPLPQPEQAAPSTEKPTYDTLPSWLSAPIRVSQDTRTPFTELGLLPKPARILGEKGYTEAFAVQTAALPLLLPTGKEQPGDLLISAATGSGKTLAYALPIVRDLSNGVVTRLRALVVLPTRELVKQAQEVFELCARAYEGEDRKRVRIGVAIGSQSLSSEQDSLMGSETRYDPETYKKLEEQTKLRVAGGGDLDDLLNDTTTQENDPRIGPWEGQIIDFYSKVDVLICTPGRLVEHIEQTSGFTLDYVRWLVVDEADKLLAQSFQGWLDVVLDKFKTTKFSAREFPDMPYTGVRKVILSATLTRDLSLLNQLALRRPRLVVLESDGDVQVADHSLPALLKEFAVRVHDANLKPLYLLDLLRGQQMTMEGQKQEPMGAAETKKATDEDSSSESSSNSDSDSGSDTSSDSDSDSDTSSDSDSSSDEEDTPSQSTKSQIPMSLIFTKSNESALRLSRLLTLLDKSLSSHISTLTSTTPTSIRRKTLRAFSEPSSSLRLIIASDLVARGIDIPKLAHVINYDLPPSVAGYVHRVGRTARAGRSGCAWTLVGDGESGWFWGKIAKGSGVKRAQKVERTRIEEMSEERIQEYEDALEKLGKEALESRRR